MKRSVLSPEQAAWLAQTFDRNRKYAGLRMMADDPARADDPKPGDDPKEDPKPDDEKLGEGGKKALEAERAKARAAEDATRALKGELDSIKSIFAKAAGIEVKEGDKDEDVLNAVQQELAAIRQESAVLKLANTHKITDEGDLTILASATDAEQMKALAERLAPKEQESDAKSRNKPKPDRTQGGGDGSGGSGGGSIAAHREQLAADRAAKKATSNV